jgi:Methyltransferase domain
MLRLPLRQWLKHPLTAVADIAAHPLEVWTTIQGAYVESRERGQPRYRYEADEHWEPRVHASMGAAWPCEATSEFLELWPKIIRELEGKGIRAGPESFADWNDGDAGLVRAIWCLIRHRKPKTVIETGVAHGVTSRVILEALERNGDGHLWSIDLPPLERAWQSQVGAAVGDRYADRWSYIKGSSARRLPALLSRLGQIDLFIHDSLHSESNVRFELDRAWAALGPIGALVVDDVDANNGFRTFTQTFSGHQSMICEAEPLSPDLRRFNKKGLFGIILKKPPALG